jgi:hypothetical protein
MTTYTVQVQLNSKETYNGVFEFDNLDDAVEKVNSNIDTGCNAVDALDGLEIYGAAHYFDRFGDGSCVISNGSK